MVEPIVWEALKFCWDYGRLYYRFLWEILFGFLFMFALLVIFVLLFMFGLLFMLALLVIFILLYIFCIVIYACVVTYVCVLDQCVQICVCRLTNGDNILSCGA